MFLSCDHAQSRGAQVDAIDHAFVAGATDQHRRERRELVYAIDGKFDAHQPFVAVADSAAAAFNDPADQPRTLVEIGHGGKSRIRGP